jgi:hypothetical protein
MGFELFPSVPTFVEAVDRLDLPLVSPELFAGDFGAVVFAINSSFSVDNDNLTIANYATCLRAHQKDETQAPSTGGASPFFLWRLQAPRGIGYEFNTRRQERQGTLPLGSGPF